MSNDRESGNFSPPPLTSLPHRLDDGAAPQSLDMTASSPQPQTPTSPSMPPSSSYKGQSFQHQRRRRSSGLSSSAQDRSPVSPRGHRHRFSNASQDSFLALRDETNGDAGGEGMGNLADELDQMSDGSDFDETEVDISAVEDGGSSDHKLRAAAAGTADGEVASGSVVDGARDSGIDVSYEESRRKVGSRDGAASKGGGTGADEEGDEMDDRLSPDLEDLITTIARLAASTNTSSSSSTTSDQPSDSKATTSGNDNNNKTTSTSSLDDDPLIPRTLALLQDLGNQSSLEASTQRLTTSTNSITANLTTQTRTLQSLSSTLYTPFGSSTFTPPDVTALSETLPLLETLLQSLPGHPPDTSPLTGLQKLDRDSASVVSALSQLTDTLQMGKQATNAASRHLRTTEAMVIELRRDRERADKAREELKEGIWENRVKERWCRDECRDILEGFEGLCEGLRKGIVSQGEEAVGA